LSKQIAAGQIAGRSIPQVGRVRRQLRVDAVEKVRGILLTSNNRIIRVGFWIELALSTLMLNRCCSYRFHIKVSSPGIGTIVNVFSL
jgi:hypothetical protein